MRARLKKSQSGTPLINTEDLEDWAEADEDDIVRAITGHNKYYYFVKRIRIRTQCCGARAGTFWP